MILKRILLLIAFIIICIKLHSQSLDFYREDLSFNLKDTYFTVKGDYYFCNDSKDSINQILFYPFPIDSLYGAVDSIHIIDLKKQEEIAFKTEKAGVYFIVKLSPYGNNKFNIQYRQKLLGHKATYILLTTKQWRKPFEQVNYTLTVDKKYTVQSVSYPSDSIITTNKNKVYKWHKENFMPNKDMIVEFK